MNKRGRLLHFARKHLGKPYKYGAKPAQTPKVFDCSSFVQYLYKRIGINLPRTALDQASVGKTIPPDRKELQVGDLLFFKGGWGHYNPQFPNGIGHVGIYCGSGKVINARYQQIEGKDGGKVSEEDVDSFLNREDFTVVKRVLE